MTVRRASSKLSQAALLVAAFTVPSAGAQAQLAGTPDSDDRAASKWKTWVLSSGSEIRPPPPPDDTTTRIELERLRSMIASRDPALRDRITWWDAAAPAYRWNQIAREEAIRAGLNANLASRRLALLHIALADAMIAVWDGKYAYGRPRPTSLDATLPTVISAPSTPSYPDEHAAAGAAAATVLSEFFPQRKAELLQLAEEAGRMRLLAGVSFPSDVDAGAELGRRAAMAALEKGRQDGAEDPWKGSVPGGQGQWSGTNPVMPQAAKWKTWLLKTGDEFRPPAPPAFDSPEFKAEMAQVRGFQRTPTTNAQALFWEVAVGGLRNFDYWNEHAGRLLLEHGQAGDAPRAARVFALLNAAFYDAGVACWDAKYTYWTIRPSQLDPDFKTVFQNPNHPSYPSAHVCYSMTSAVVLSHLFPRDASKMMALGRESGDSRIWAGIHYPMDITAGQQLAERVAERTIEWAKSDGAERGRP
jgi:membrane-associated phospholipid phosphatase